MTNCEYSDEYFYCYNPKLVDPSGQDPTENKMECEFIYDQTECAERPTAYII